MWLRGKRKVARLANVHWQAQHLTDKRHDKRRGRDCCRLTGRGGPGEIKGGQASVGATALLVHGGELYSSSYTALFNWQLRTRRRYGPGPYSGVSFCCRSRAGMSLLWSSFQSPTPNVYVCYLERYFIGKVCC